MGLVLCFGSLKNSSPLVPLVRAFGGYFLYALLEITLVTVGILIAIKVNNMNDARLERKQEQTILSTLANELKLNLSQLGIKISKCEEILAADAALLEMIGPDIQDMDIAILNQQLADLEDIEDILTRFVIGECRR